MKKTTPTINYTDFLEEHAKQQSKSSYVIEEWSIFFFVEAIELAHILFLARILSQQY